MARVRIAEVAVVEKVTAEETEEIVLKRLKRIEGQVRGIEKMIVAGRECESIVTQLAALRSAIESVGALILNNYMKLCLRKDPKGKSTSIDSLARAIAIWGRVRVGDKT
jgi:DNA-binding FrmR family transcriptional regulator